MKYQMDLNWISQKSADKATDFSISMFFFNFLFLLQSITENCVFVLHKFIYSVEKRIRKMLKINYLKKFSTWMILKFQPNHRKVSIEFGFQRFNLWTILSLRLMLLKWSIDINTILQNLAQFLTIHTVKYGYQIGTHTNSVL